MKNQMTISSVNDLQLKMPKIIEEHGSNQAITTLALANPILALKKIGYEFTADAEEEIELLIRFGPEGKAVYDKAKSEIMSQSKAHFSLRDREKLISVVCKSILASERDDQNRGEGKNSKKNRIQIPSPQQIEKIISEDPKMDNGKYADPLEVYAAINPIIPPLLKIRKLETVNPGLAKEADIPQLLQKAASSSLKTVTFDLNRKIKS